MKDLKLLDTYIRVNIKYFNKMILIKLNSSIDRSLDRLISSVLIYIYMSLFPSHVPTAC